MESILVVSELRKNNNDGEVADLRLEIFKLRVCDFSGG